MTGSSTPLTQVAEICAEAAVVHLPRRTRNQDKINLVPACFKFFFFLLKKINKEFVKEHY